MLLVSWYGAWRLLRQQSLPKPCLYTSSGDDIFRMGSNLSGLVCDRNGRQPWLVRNYYGT
ncbi:hypothetical protein ACT691_08610 [Vibrio metschnikovii]